MEITKVLTNLGEAQVGESGGGTGAMYPSGVPPVQAEDAGRRRRRLRARGRSRGV